MTVRQKTREALLWGAGLRVLRDLTQFGQMLVLVRLLSAEDYGRYGLVTSIVGFSGLLSARTFLGYILQLRDHEEVRVQDHFTAGIVLQLSLFLLTNLVAVGLRFSDTYRPVSTLLHVASLIFLVELPGELQSKLIERGLDFRRLRILNAAGILASTAAALLLAAMGAGVFALVLPPLLLPIPFGLDLFLRTRFRPTGQFSWACWRPAWRFGLVRAASGAMNGLRDLAQNGLFVRFFGYGTLGVFGRAVGLANMACASVAWQFLTYVYPVMTRQEAGSVPFRKAADLVMRGVVWFSLPVACVLALHAAPIVRTIYGSAWEAVIPLLPLALLESAVRSPVMSAYMTLLAANRYRLCMLQDGLMLFLGVGALVVARTAGPASYLLLLAAVKGVGGVLMVGWLLSRRFLSVAGVALAIVPPALGVTVAGVAFGACGRGIAGALPPLASAVVTSGTFVCTYLVTIRLAFPRHLGEVLGYLPGGVVARRLLFLPNRADGGEGVA